ncbi:HNH endonuclease [Clostridium tetani]|uniref:HNH nuclease domain-containing protein n=1 Tax=Clostridium tetani TaxID=1513 RepID=A0ABC8EGB6_CLOTA|nr:HNH endonuclease [Clostridium tetani]BDR82560.1 hypothetical protein K234311028_p20430 [Clostridium tetani]
MEKVCKSCGIKLDISCFTKSKNTSDGYENKCKKCRQEQRKKYMNVCETCGNTFKTAYKKSKYCSQKCKPQSKRKRIKVKCSICGKEKEVTHSRKSLYKDFYCSDECKNKGYSKQYSGENSKRYNQVEIKCEICGKVLKRNSYEIIKYAHHYCSEVCKIEGYKLLFSGKNNPNYNPNKAYEDRIKNRNIEGYKEWIRQVYKRDDYTCQCCGDNKGHNLNAHHILNYSEYKDLRLDINNGITLCKKCHKHFHDTYGYKYNTKEQLIESLNKYKNQAS